MIIINIQTRAVSQTPSLHFYDELQPQQGSSGMSQVYTDQKKRKKKNWISPKGLFDFGTNAEETYNFWYSHFIDLPV